MTLVTRPLAFTVTIGTIAFDPYVPGLAFTVANVKGTVPGPVAVPSPVSPVIYAPAGWYGPGSREPSPLTKSLDVPPVVTKAAASMFPVSLNKKPPLAITVSCTRVPPSSTGCDGKVCIIPFWNTYPIPASWNLPSIFSRAV